MVRVGLYYLLALVPFGYYILSANANAADVEIDPLDGLSIPVQVQNNTDYLTRPYCFRFTWMGQKFTNESQYKNATCEDLVNGAPGVPCFLPLVVTDNSYVPDTKWMWDRFRESPTNVACRMVRGEVCAKFSYKYNGVYENITYMCTKVMLEGGTTVNSDCFTQFDNATGREIQVCVCQSRAGQYPCNSGFIFSPLNILIFSLVFIHTMLFIGKCHDRTK